MSKSYQDRETLKCSFCGKKQSQVRQLVGGFNAFICNECIDFAYTMIHEEPEQEPDPAHEQLMSGFENALDALNALNDFGDAIDKAIDQLPAQNPQKLESEV